MKLERLTQKIVDRAERQGKVAGWYELCRAGYSPEEIHLYSPSAWPHAEVRFKVREHARRHGLPVPVGVADKRVRVQKKPHIDDPRAAFRSTVMRTGLALVLTQPMLEELCAIASNVRSDRAIYFRELGGASPYNFIGTRAALQKRGLLGNDGKLTTIGDALIALLKDAGVFKEPDEAMMKDRGA